MFNARTKIYFVLVVAGLLWYGAAAHADEVTSSTEATDTINITTSTPTTTIDTVTSTTVATTTTDTASTTVTTTIATASSTEGTTTTVTTTTTTSTTETASTTTSTTGAATTTTTSTGTEQTNTGGGGSNEPLITPTPTSTPTATPATVATTEINATIQKILNFLRSKQDADGKIIDGGTSDWAAMAFGANGTYADDIKTGTTSLLQYIYNNENLSGELNLCAAYPRHILALLASGINQSDAKILELKEKIKTECDKNNGYGPDAEINDDIFGLLALIATSEDTHSQFVQNIITAIAAKQQADGAFTSYGWAGADITGAAINALRYVSDHGATVDGTIITRAKQYLKSTQLSDGGWGWGPADALNTGWALMGINALGETQTDWFNSNGKNPWHILVGTLGEGGYYATTWSADGVDWFGTKHVVPALLGKSWPIVLSPKAPAVSQNFSGSGSAPLTVTDAPTTTISETASTTTSTVAVSSPTSTVIVTTTNIGTETIATSTEIFSPAATTAKPLTKKIKRPTPPATANSIANNITSTIGAGPTPTTNLINQLPLDTPTHRAAKRLLEVSGGSTMALGLYLGLKLLKYLI